MAFRAREEAVNVHGRFLRLKKVWLQNCAIQRKRAQINPRRSHSEKHAAQRREKLRKSFSLNYKSAALDQLSYAGARAEK